MAKTDFKVYSGKEHLASTRHPEDAVAVAARHGFSEVRWGGRIVWKRGKDTDEPTRGGYVIRQTVRAMREEALARYHPARDGAP